MPEPVRGRYPPYPFLRAHRLEGEPGAVVPGGQSQLEWKGDGIRAEISHRGGLAIIYSRGEGVVARMTPEAYAPDGETPAEAVAECEADLDRNELLGAELQDVSAVSEDGDAAVVSVTLAIGDETGTQDVPMVRLDDGWKVDIAQ